MTNTIPDPPATATPVTLEQHLADLAQSKLSTAAFARSRGIPAWKIYNALQKKTRHKARQRKQSALVPVVLAPTALMPTAPIELVLAGGHRLLVPDSFDADALRRLMGVLSGC